VEPTPPAAKKGRVRRFNYRQRETWSTLKLAVHDYAAHLQESIDGLYNPIALTTVHDNAKRFACAAKKHNITTQEVSYEQFWEDSKPKNPPLLSPNQVLFLQEAIVSRDNGNNPMTRHEVIQLITEISQTFDEVKAKNHFDYLIREGRLTILKRGGRVMTAQATTTKRSAITMEQQWRWHSTFDWCFNEVSRLNTFDGTGVDFQDVCDHFVGNIDESCFMANGDGSIKVIASSHKKKTEAIRDDCRSSITSLRSGNAAGDQGPFIFLAKGKKNDCHRSLNPRSLENDQCMPTGSYIAMCDNAYMTDVVWLEVVPKLCAGIRAMPIIKDHPEWWCMFTLDGFGSHVNVHEALKIFTEYKILITKEEGDSSQVNQAYDQLVARADKRHLNCSLIKIKKTLKSKMTQWHLIKIAANAQMKVSRETWVKSFIKVNCHPKFRISFADWLDRLRDKGILQSGDSFYDDNIFGLFDAMPAFWKRMPVVARQGLVDAIDNMKEEAEDNETTVWSATNIRVLTKFVPLEDMHKTRACYLAAKEDAKVIVTTEEQYMKRMQQLQQNEGESSSGINEDSTNKKLENYFSFKPQMLLDAFIEERQKRPATLTSASSTRELFDHMCNHAAQMHWDKAKSLLPAAALDVEVSADQTTLFNPSYKNVLQGYIMYDVKGAGAMNKIAKRRLDIMSGNVASYARCLNNKKHLGSLKEYNELIASVAEISAEMEVEKQRKREEASAKATERQEKKKQAVKDFKTIQEAKMPELQALMKKRSAAAAAVEDGGSSLLSIEDATKNYLLALSKRQLMDLLKYYYAVKVPGVAKMQKEELVDELWRQDSMYCL